ncbi:MAG: ATP-binding cassette domain-containing protein, partial [Bryobacteraceae bacterium]|nr:ATP-binding cassette domain-containing protein [Bryobacteraceae bacterium]
MSNLTPPLIELRNAYVMRGDRLVLRDFSLIVGAGEHVAILGPNGCGKSTLIRTLTREFYPLARPDTVVRIFGRERWNVFELRSLLGIVPGALPHLSKDVTGREMVLSGFFSSVGIWPNHIVTPEMVGKAEEVMERMEAAHLAERDFDELSSGEARRILIARALVNDPKTLLLDEPTTSLDLFAQHELREIMRKLGREGTGILLITHHLSDIIPEIDRVVMLKDGRVVGDGPRSAMLV